MSRLSIWQVFVRGHTGEKWQSELTHGALSWLVVVCLGRNLKKALITSCFAPIIVESQARPRNNQTCLPNLYMPEYFRLGFIPEIYVAIAKMVHAYSNRT